MNMDLILNYFLITENKSLDWMIGERLEE